MRDKVDFKTVQYSLAIYALTPQGLDLAIKVLEVFELHHGPARVYAFAALKAAHPLQGMGVTWFSSLSEVVGSTFHLFPAHLFVAATGIVVRTIAPHLKSKATDPAVVVMDQKGKYAVSLLSGHLGGANDLAAFLADALGAAPVITTATDAEGLPSLDMAARNANVVMPDMAGIKRFSAALVAGRPVRVEDPENILGLAGKLDNALFPDVTVRVSHNVPLETAGEIVALYPKVLYAGIGCRRGTESRDIVSFLKETFSRQGLSLHSLATLASIDAKAGEAGLLEAGVQLGVPIRFFSSEFLGGFPVTAISEKAMKTFGTPGVAEPAALAAAKISGGVADLIMPKQKGRGITLAVALAHQP